MTVDPQIYSSYVDESKSMCWTHSEAKQAEQSELGQARRMMLGKIEGRRGRGRQRMRRLGGITDSMGLGGLLELEMDMEA